MLKTFLVPVDGSALSVRAIPFALRLVRASHGRLVLVRAHLPAGDSLSMRLHYPAHSVAERSAIERGLAEAELIVLTDQLRRVGVEVEPRFVEGSAADVILSSADASHTEMILMATHAGDSVDRMVHGSVADDIVRHTSTPVLMIPARCRLNWSRNRPLKILVALDGSDLALRVLEPVAAMTEITPTQIELLSIVEPLRMVSAYGDALPPPDLESELVQAENYLAHVARTLRVDIDQPVGVRVAYGSASEMIAHVARETHADVIAMATHGRGGVARLALGSVASDTLARARVPTLLIPRRQTASRLPSELHSLTVASTKERAAGER